LFWSTRSGQYHRCFCWARNQAVLCTIYVVDLSEFAVINEVYQDFFSPPYPARATVQVVALPRQARIEISAIVAL
jgi:2-iminobutanoate/2-iminopropanoate deaminase